MARGAGDRPQGGEDQGIIGVQRDGGSATPAGSIHGGAGELQARVVPGLVLADMSGHRRSPSGEHRGGGNIDQDGRNILRLGVGREGVIQQRGAGVGGERLEFGQSTVASEARGVAHEAAEAGVIGVLIFHEAGGEHDSWAVAPNQRREGERVRRGDFKVGIAGELDEFVRRAQQRRGLGRLGGAFRGGAVGARFAARADDAVHGPTSRGGLSDNPAHAKFEIVGVGAKGEEGSEFRHRCKLRRSGLWGHG